MCDRFVLPLDEGRDSSPSTEDAVCVVGVVSKDPVASRRLVDQSTERPRLSDARASQKGCILECSYDAERCIVYVELISEYDVISVDSDHVEIPWEEQVKQEREYLQALLLLFSICHIVIIFMPHPHIDLSYIKMLKLVGHFRQTVEEKVVGLLKQKLDATLWEAWQDDGRCCVPVLLTVFAETLPMLSSSSRSSDSSHNVYEESRSSRREQPPLKRLQSALEDQMHTIMSKCDVMSGPSSLLKLNRRGCVHVLPYKSLQNALSPVSLVLNTISPSQGQPKGSEDFKTFIDRHTDTIFSSLESQLPTFDAWVSVSSALHQEFSDLSGLASEMPTSLTPLEEFSESLCEKAYSLAIKTYKENLSARFTEREIQLQLAHCKHVYQLNARGPAFGKYLERLEKESSEIEPPH